jgi:hypothetical protein
VPVKEEPSYQEYARREVQRADRLYRQWNDLGLVPPDCVDEAIRDVDRAYKMVVNRSDGHMFVRFVTLFADLISWRYIQRGTK